MVTHEPVATMYILVTAIMVAVLYVLIYVETIHIVNNIFLNINNSK